MAGCLSAQNTGGTKTQELQNISQTNRWLCWDHFPNIQKKREIDGSGFKERQHPVKGMPGAK